MSIGHERPLSNGERRIKTGKLNYIVPGHFVRFIIIFTLWLNWSMVKRSILIGSLSGRYFAISIRSTTHKLISLICVLDKIFERKHFAVKKKPFSCCVTKDFGGTSAKMA